ncbi:hypothetical protein MIN45_P1236 [Methylomarinovum tepidoasis]|uniref:Uncharacterized protein n=1 Tax=Methylomarinovum tepidoasis TaxID=2840183 RepID=A0AAU9CHM8_9GAMM|nr:hypothetical protein [Methylomarinovum sp. IN45]BCX88866.1 hypothetical protein MIN45_P1236 [Methylomarinovum sp. IN45]
MYEFFEAFNTYAATHPEVLKVMHVLFWLRWWLFVALIGAFIYLMWADRRRYLAEQRRKEVLLGREPASGRSRFIA